MGSLENKIRSILSYRDNSGLSIFAREVGGATQAFRKSLDDDIGEVVNEALEYAGQDGFVQVESERYTQADGIALGTTIQTAAEGQGVDFNGADLQFEDNASGNMIEIAHDGCKVKNVKLEGRQDETSISSCITNNEEIEDISIEDVTISGAPDGILLDGVDDSDIRNTGSAKSGDSIGNALNLKNCTDITVLNAKTKGFRNDGIRMEWCF